MNYAATRHAVYLISGAKESVENETRGQLMFERAYSTKKFSEDRDPDGGRRLVLGFDGGCFTCADLAKSIEERLDGKLEVRNLRDPQVREWCRRALGNDAPWAPTLLEIEEGEIRAWTGWKLAANLSRSVGPVATWRVMQELGEVTAVPEIKASAFAKAAGMSRGQFLRGMGGAAVAMSVLSGGSVFSSVAAAQESSLSPGTDEMRQKARQIVRASPEYQALADLQSLLGVGFTFPEIGFHKVNDRNHGVVAVNSRHNRRSIGAIFNVNMYTERMYFYSHEVFAPMVDQPNATRITTFRNGRAIPDYHKVTMGTTENWVVLEDNSLISKEQFTRRVEGDQQTSAIQSDGGVGYCTELEYNSKVNMCLYNGAFACGAVGVLNTPLGIVCGVYIGFSGGCQNMATAECARPPEESAVAVQEPPRYYCT